MKPTKAKATAEGSGAASGSDGAGSRAATGSSIRAEPSVIAIGLVLFVATLLLFSRVLGPDYEFVNYDDPDYVTKNAQVQAGLDGAGMRWALTSGAASNWHPLTWMSHMLDWSWWGNNPRGHHATSVVLHALNAALAFLALRKLTGAVWTSAFCAALFAWHPLRAESVAWVAERKDMLSGFFWFATLLAYGAYADARVRATGRAAPYYVLTLVALALGLMAKPMLVTLPCVLLLLDVWPLRRLGSSAGVQPASSSMAGWTPLLEKIPFFALAAASSYVTFRVQQAGGSVAEALDFGARLGNAFVAVVRYLGKFGWPFDLAVLYPHPGHWATGKITAAVLMVAALSAAALWQGRRRPWMLIGWLWFLGTLVPVIGLVQVGMQAMADRYTYLTILGVQLALLWTLRDAFTSDAARRRLAWVGALVLVGCAARTWNQLGVWRNSETLFSHAIAVTTNNFVAHDNRGLYRFEHGRVEEAVADYRQALAINPGYMNPNNNLGHALAQSGRPAEALPFYRAALAAKPEHVEVRNNLANALSDVGQLDEAMTHYAFVLARQPDHANALNGSAVVLAMQGKPAEAKQRLEQAVRIAPGYAGAHNNLGNVCSMLKEWAQAAAHYRRAAELQPDAHTHAQLAHALRQLGRRDDAVRELRTALKIRPDYAPARQALQELEAGR